MNWFKLCLLSLLLIPAIVRAEEGGTLSAGSRLEHVGMVAADKLAEASWPGVGFIYERVAIGKFDLWTWNGQFCTYHKAEGQTKYHLEKPEHAAELLGKPGTALSEPWRYRYPNGLVWMAGLFGGSLVLRMFRTVSDSKPRTSKGKSAAPVQASTLPAWKPAPAEPLALQPTPKLPPVSAPGELAPLKPVGSEPQGAGGSVPAPVKALQEAGLLTPSPALPPPSAPPPPVVPPPAPAEPAAAKQTVPTPAKKESPAPARKFTPADLEPRTPMLALVFRPFQESAAPSRKTPPPLPADEKPAKPAAAEKKQGQIFWEIPATALKERSETVSAA